MNLPLKLYWSMSALAILLASPALAYAQAGNVEATDEETMALTPETLSDALSCRSHEAAMAFASALFLDDKAPDWMHEAEEEKDVEGMIGLYAYRLSHPASLRGEAVDRVYFMKDWVVALWPRARALAFIQAQNLERAPIKMTEQYYRFVDPESGPMLGAFEPTGNATAAMLARAFGAELPPTPPSESLFVGCNYAPASEANFLEAAGQTEEMMNGAARDIGNAAAPDQPR
ncbi:hypothetical protein MOK15_17130 [Sphingobium sp. BYY-5]|uniref:hypothetical protein n=1 Tax=Sphingobium sp. BYY-5 TaxID=2926400 RepID=UPI001FA70EDF|nr:hypothetical protein [Sphingobium sp. BYY-5]MCI4591808.1 hypothetical protein [Sphingobium sp. BYY-5]